MDINILLFHDFETLDVFGPVEILAREESHNMKYVSLEGGIITSAQGTQILTEKIENMDNKGILVVPGGRGTRPLAQNEEFLQMLMIYAENSSYCLSICTGSALLAKAGVLDGKKATSNKKAFDWVISLSDKVQWDRPARWVADGKFYTSAGVSAGMDMSLGFIADQYGMEKAKKIAEDIEYDWKE